MRLDENKTDDPRAWVLDPGVARALAAWRAHRNLKPENVSLVFDAIPFDWDRAAEARAEYFSQKNSEELLGVPPRRFLALLRRPDAPPVTKLGRLRLVEREHMLAFLRTLGSSAPPSTPANDLDGPDRILAEIGCVPGPGRRRVG